MSITEVPFRSSEATPPGVEVLSFDALLERARGHLINPSSPMRPSFHHLVAVRGGRLDCSVDFTEHQLVEGDLIWVRPGQILQFGTDLATSRESSCSLRRGSSTMPRCRQHTPTGPLSRLSQCTPPRCSP